MIPWSEDLAWAGWRVEGSVGAWILPGALCRGILPGWEEGAPTDSNARPTEYRASGDCDGRDMMA